MKKYFKVKYGFGSTDKVRIEESELKKTMYAQLKGTPVQLGNVVVNGRNIIAITPDYNYYTGWYDGYEPKDSEDWNQIERDCPKFDGVIEYHKDKLMHILKTGQNNLITEKDEYIAIEKPKEEYSDIVKQITESTVLRAQ